MYAAIDAGSNTLRLLVGRAHEGRVVPQAYLRRICRLAGDFSSEKGLAAESMQRTLSALSEFAAYCRANDILKIGAVGTAAFRDASNGKDFAREIYETTGIPLRVISGEEEAQLSAAGVLSALDPSPEYVLVVDVGGGSTEYVLLLRDRVVWSESFPLGVVRLTESCERTGDRHDEISRVTEDVYKKVSNKCTELAVSVEDVVLVGTAGTVTTLAALDMEMENYDWRRVNNYSLGLKALQQWHDRLLPLNPSEREKFKGMEVGRGDLIVAGIEILLALLNTFGHHNLVVSDFGILEGLLLTMEKGVKTPSSD